VFISSREFPQVCFKKHENMKNKVFSEVDQDDERDCLSDSHRNFMQRYVEYELRRQEKMSKTFLQERFEPAVTVSTR
jgi:hypothetical protein